MNIDVEKVIREYIGKSPHMSLATVSGDKPWVCEVHFAYDENLNLYFRSKPATRHSQEIAINSNVAGNIVRQHALDEYPHAIYFEGTAEMMTDENRFETLCGYFMNLGIGNESMIDDAKKADGHKFYKITVENWYAFGKFGSESGQKHKLEWNGGKK
ncbi:pyridoxamine 5'-phosphate oxidase family protein [Candidatus Saccharibacteria bacterium]|nr:pyridoxamine 5'-phosphate oxidase family protein [Candidatus Saccharibacteria bacterium]